jgi:hypothetical protein
MPISFVLSKLRHPHIWRRIFMERLTEPLHVNLFSAGVMLCGSLRSRVEHDLIVRPHNAYSILRAADYAREMGLKALSLIELGVASGAGLINMARIAEQVSRVTGISLRVYGFDTGHGMPPPADYRDHPDLYTAGDFAMDERLRENLPENAELLLGDVAQTIPSFLASLSPAAPIGYVVFDLDYYSSTRVALQILTDREPTKYLPITLIYFDDVSRDRHNSWCGELLAINEFNRLHERRKIERQSGLAESRIYRRASWIRQIYYLHTLDHPARLAPLSAQAQSLQNPYLPRAAKPRAASIPVGRDGDWVGQPKP